MEIFDNVTRVVKDDLETTIGLGCRVSIAAACLSIYAYQERKSLKSRYFDISVFDNIAKYIDFKGLIKEVQEEVISSEKNAF